MPTENTEPPAPIEVNLREYLRLQTDIAIHDPFNRWVTGVELGREPTNTDCIMHFILCGGAAHFAQQYRVVRS